MQIAVLGSATSWYVADLRRAAGESHTIVPITYRQLCSQVDMASVTLDSGEVDLRRSDCVLVRSMPPGSLEQVIFRMNALAVLERRASRQFATGDRDRGRQIFDDRQTSRGRTARAHDGRLPDDRTGNGKLFVARRRRGHQADLWR